MISYKKYLVHGLFQGGAVVDSGTGDDLTVHGDAGLGQLLHNVDTTSGILVTQHHGTHQVSLILKLVNAVWLILLTSH